MTGPDWREPLEWMSGDLCAWEWADRLGIEPAQVKAYCAARGLPLLDEYHRLRTRVRVLEALLSDLWPEVTP